MCNIASRASAAESSICITLLTGIDKWPLIDDLPWTHECGIVEKRLLYLVIFGQQQIHMLYGQVRQFYSVTLPRHRSITAHDKIADANVLWPYDVRVLWSF